MDADAGGLREFRFSADWVSRKNDPLDEGTAEEDSRDNPSPHPNSRPIATKHHAKTPAPFATVHQGLAAAFPPTQSEGPGLSARDVAPHSDLAKGSVAQHIRSFFGLPKSLKSVRGLDSS